jgi:16S rRNA (uracil1498-N3)-methyltransferase
MANPSPPVKTKSMTRIFIDQELNVGDEIELPRDSARHVVQVLRLNQGAPITLFNGRGGEHRGVIESINKRSATVSILEYLPIERESALRITLVQGVSRGDRMDFSIQKAAELGAFRIVPLHVQRTGVRLTHDRATRRLAHWQGIIRHACEQSGRNQIPELTKITSLDEFIASRDADVGLVMSPRGVGDLAQMSLPGRTIALVIGPEGGFEDAELDELRHAGLLEIRLGPRILRTETAAVVGLSILQAQYGDLLSGNETASDPSIAHDTLSTNSPLD